MQEYKTLQTVDLFGGKIGLADDQYKPRAGKLKKLKPAGLYEIQAPIQFKRGEVVRLDPADVPKGMAAFLEPVKKPEPEKDADK